jgi:hypothetical protein
MTARQAAVLALFLPALTLGAVACGGSKSGTKTTAAQQRAIERHWRSGLMRWHDTTQHALNGISVIFSTQASVDSIRKEASRTSASLAGFEAILVRCSRTIHALGPVPPVFATAGRYAARACDSLEKGEHAVENVVGTLRKGGLFETLDPIGGAGDLLSAGQAQLTTAVRALDMQS